MNFIVDNANSKLYRGFKVRNKKNGKYTCWGNYSWIERESGKLYTTLNGGMKAIIANVSKDARDNYEVVEVTILESYKVTSVTEYRQLPQSPLKS